MINARTKGTPVEDRTRDHLDRPTLYPCAILLLHDSFMLFTFCSKDYSRNKTFATVVRFLCRCHQLLVLSLTELCRECGVHVAEHRVPNREVLGSILTLVTVLYH